MNHPELDPSRLYPCLQALGYALWQAQLLEGALAHYLVIVHQLSPGTAREQAEQIFDKAGERTTGQLLGMLRDKEGQDAPLVVRLEALVPERNWLVHRSWHQNHRDLFDVGRTNELLDRLSRVADEALSLAKSFQQALEAYVVATGVPRETLDRYAAEIAQEWGAG